MMFSSRERRLLGFAFDGNVGDRIHSEMGGSTPPESARAPGQNTERGVDRPQVNAFLSDVQKRIEEKGKRLEELPGQFKENFERHIADYLVTSIPRFDRNSNRVLETASDPNAQSEFALYKAEMLQGVDKIIDPLLGVEDRAKTDADRRKREAETKRRTLDDQMGALSEAIAVQDPERLQSPEGISLSNPQEIEQYMKEYDERAQAVRAYGNKLSGIHQEVMLLPEKWQEYLKPTASDTAVAGGLVAAGVAASFIPGVNIAVWAGAGLGALIYAGVRAAQAVAIRREQEAKAQVVNKRIADVRAQFAAAQGRLAEVHQGMERDGQALHAAPGQLREEDMKVLAERREQIQKRRSQVTAGIEEGQKAQAETAQHEMEMGRQREELGKAEAELKERLAKTGASQRELQNRTQVIRERAGGIADRRQELQTFIQNAPEGSEERAKAEQSLKQLEEGAGRVREMTLATQQGEKLVGEQRAKMEQGQRSVEEGRQALDEQRVRTAAATENIQEFLGTLDTENMGLAEAEQSIDSFQQYRTEELNTRTEQVAEGVTTALLANHLTIGNLNHYTEEVGRIPDVEPQSYFGIVWSNTFESVGNAWSSLWKGVGGGLQDFLGRNAVTNFIAGLAEAVGAFGEGMMHMAAHPGDALKGIVAMVNVFDWEGFKTTYAGLWDFLTAKEDFDAAANGVEGASGEKAWGKAVGNFALFLIPGYGAVGNGVRGAATAFRLARSAGTGVARATVNAGIRFTATAVPQFTQRIAMMPIDMLRGIAHLPMGVVRAGMGLRSGAALGDAVNAARTLRTRAVGIADDLAAARSRGVTGRQLTQLERQAVEAAEAARGAEAVATAAEEVQGARNARTEARNAVNEGRRLSPQEQELAGLAQRERTLAASEQQVAQTEANLSLAQAEQQLGASVAGLNRLTVNGRSVASVAESQGGLSTLAGLSDLELCRAFGVNPTNPLTINRIIRLRQQLTTMQRAQGMARAGRVHLAETVLEHPLSPAEAEVMMSAHELPGFGRGTIRFGQTRAKYEQMIDTFAERYGDRTSPLARRRARADIRRLMDEGVTGTPPPPATDLLLPSSADDFVRSPASSSNQTTLSVDTVVEPVNPRSPRQPLSPRSAVVPENAATPPGTPAESVPPPSASQPRMGILERPRSRPRTASDAPAIDPQTAAWRNRYSRMGTVELDAAAADLGARWQEALFQEVNDPGRAAQWRRRASALERELQQVEITRSIDHANFEYEGGGGFHRNPRYEGRPVHTDSRNRIESALGIDRVPDADAVFLGERAGQALVGRWNRRRGRYETQAYDIDSPQVFARDMEVWSRLRRTQNNGRLLQLERDLAHRENLPPRQAELLEHVRGEIRYRLERNDPAFIKAYGEHRALEAAAIPAPQSAPTSAAEAARARPASRARREAGIAWRLSRAGGQPVRLGWYPYSLNIFPNWLGGNHVRAAVSGVSTFAAELTGIPRIVRRYKLRNLQRMQQNAQLLRANGDETGAAALEQTVAARRANLQRRWKVSRELRNRNRPSRQASSSAEENTTQAAAENAEGATAAAPSAEALRPPRDTSPIRVDAADAPAGMVVERDLSPIQDTATADALGLRIEGTPAPAVAPRTAVPPQPSLSANGGLLVESPRFLEAVQKRMNAGQPLTIPIEGVPTEVTPLRFAQVSGRPAIVVRRGPPGTPEQTISLEGMRVRPPRAPSSAPVVEPPVAPSPTPAAGPARRAAPAPRNGPITPEQVIAKIERQMVRPGQSPTAQNIVYIDVGGVRVPAIPTAISGNRAVVTFRYRNPANHQQILTAEIPINRLRGVRRQTPSAVEQAAPVPAVQPGAQPPVPPAGPIPDWIDVNAAGEARVSGPAQPPAAPLSPIIAPPSTPVAPAARAPAVPPPRGRQSPDAARPRRERSPRRSPERRARTEETNPARPAAREQTPRQGEGMSDTELLAENQRLQERGAPEQPMLTDEQMLALDESLNPANRASPAAPVGWRARIRNWWRGPEEIMPEFDVLDADLPPHLRNTPASVGEASAAASVAPASAPRPSLWQRLVGRRRAAQESRTTGYAAEEPIAQMSPQEMEAFNREALTLEPEVPAAVRPSPATPAVPREAPAVSTNLPLLADTPVTIRGDVTNAPCRIVRQENSGWYVIENEAGRRYTLPPSDIVPIRPPTPT